ncbi:MAG TPA: L,D-transpeptidase family protein, partial [Flavisolibacter sp.]|nr:L,D-transpeptidase family protein [Flavisolibacter sp.]
YKIDWKSLSATYFPYHIRQSTGCDNALGIVKFEFYNPFTVYLHDTPNKGLFSFNKRYFSHGCMRVEKPVELAHLLLGRNRIAIDTLTAKGCLNQQAPKPVAVEKELPVMILYSTVWYNKEGEVRFYDDVYGKN